MEITGKLLQEEIISGIFYYIKAKHGSPPKRSIIRSYVQNIYSKRWDIGILNREIILDILSFLDLKDMTRFLVSCKKFYDLHDECWITYMRNAYPGSILPTDDVGKIKMNVALDCYQLYIFPGIDSYFYCDYMDIIECEEIINDRFTILKHETEDFRDDVDANIRSDKRNALLYYRNLSPDNLFTTIPEPDIKLFGTLDNFCPKIKDNGFGAKQQVIERSSCVMSKEIISGVYGFLQYKKERFAKYSSLQNINIDDISKFVYNDYAERRRFNFPNEIVLKIIENLDTYEDVLNFMVTCKEYYNLHDEIWRLLHNQYFPDSFIEKDNIAFIKENIILDYFEDYKLWGWTKMGEIYQLEEQIAELMSEYGTEPPYRYVPPCSRCEPYNNYNRSTSVPTQKKKVGRRRYHIMINQISELEKQIQTIIEYEYSDYKKNIISRATKFSRTGMLINVLSADCCLYGRTVYEDCTR